MNGVAPWLGGTLTALLALFGLLVASRAEDGPFYLFGLALFLFGILCIFGLIARATRTPQPAHGGGEARAGAEMGKSHPAPGTGAGGTAKSGSRAHAPRRRDLV